jgi:hypothetical protein
MARGEAEPLLLLERQGNVRTEREAVMLLRRRSAPPAGVGKEEGTDVVTTGR